MSRFYRLYIQHIFHEKIIAGSGLKICVYIKLAYLGLEESFREELLNEYGLECIKARNTMSHQRLFVVSNKRTFGITESEILSSMYRGLKKMIDLENRFASMSYEEEEKEMLPI